MRYSRPFTPQQRRKAIQAYRSYRKHREQLRGFYPPADDEQRRILADYGDTIREIAEELRKPDRSVNVGALIEADAWATWLAMEYRRLQT